MRSVLISTVLLAWVSSLTACADQVVGFPASDQVRPTIVATTPTADAVEVDLETAISATFSEAMAPATISSTTFTVMRGNDAVAGNVSLVGLTAFFTPTDALDGNTLYRVTVSHAAADVAGNALAQDHTWSFTTGPAADHVAPQVSATVATGGATSVPRNAPLTITFSEAMDPATISATSITLVHGGTAVPGTVTYSGVTAMFDPSAMLDGSTSYTARIGDTATDLAGNPLAQDFVWSFTTGSAPDATAPLVSSTTPANGATGVALNTPITVTFSEPMSPASISTSTFTLMRGATPVTGTVIYVGVTAVFTPTTALAGDTAYTATVTDGVTDIAGNALAADHVWSFTTGSAPDLVAPLVSATVPASGAIGVALDADLAATFSEAMSPASISTATFTLHRGATAIAGTVTYVGVSATFAPMAALDPNTSYTARITVGVTDLAGNHLAQDYTWSFTTGDAPDVRAPVVSATEPSNGATGVALNASLSATFSEPMAPLTITTATFTLLDGATPVSGAVSYSGVTAVFTPTVPLRANTVYAATIHDGVTDLAGLHLAADHHWSFTTGPVPDTQRPHVTFTIPPDDATQMPIDSDIVVVFSERMDPLSINTADFSVQQLGTLIVGTVTYSNLSATFHPTSALPANTTFSATVTTSARDLAGNALARNFVWNFRTSATLDATRPHILATFPADDASDVPLNSVVTATFDEPMDPLSLTALTFTLMDGVTPVVGSVITVGATAVFAPATLLDPDTEYTATITTGATDLAGNHLSNSYTWHFTTGDELDATAPTVVLENPADLASGVPIDTTINAVFSEAMNPQTLTTATFVVTGPDTSEVVGTVRYDPANLIATFQPLGDLMPDTTYTVTITSEATDLAGEPLAADAQWTFTTGAEAAAMSAVDLASLTPFAIVAGAGLTNSNSGGTTTINGDVGLSPGTSCQGDGSACSLTNPVINGTLYVNDPAGVAARAKADLTAAYLDATLRPVGTTVNELSGLVLAPGVYTSDSTMSVAVDGVVTLDGQGDANAVWIFQIGSSLTVNNNAQIRLQNGARAKNVFWAAFASSTLGTNVHFEGSILAGASNSVGTGSVVIGRLLCTTGIVTLLSNTITRPPL